MKFLFFMYTLSVTITNEKGTKKLKKIKEDKPIDCYGQIVWNALSFAYESTISFVSSCLIIWNKMLER